MDPLSVTASIVAVATLAGQTCSAFAKLRDLCRNLPGRLHALNNEVADIQIVLNQVAAVIEARGRLPKSEHEPSEISHLLTKATTKLTELKGIVERLAVVCETARIPITRANAWRKEQKRLHELQDDIKNVKCDLNVLLGTSNSRDMMHIRLDLESISAAASQSIEEQELMQAGFLQDLSRHSSNQLESIMQVDDRISRIEEMLKAQSEQLQQSQYKQVGPQYGIVPHRRRKLRTLSDDRRSKQALSDGVSVRVQQNNACRPGCLCVCHRQKKAATTTVADRVLGRVFVGYSGLPFISPKCDMSDCEKSRDSSISVEYWFPSGFFWSQIVRLQVAYQPNIGPHLQLSTLRRVPDTAKCVNYAMSGNIDGLKELFKSGLASPRDVSTTRGYSVLRWALYSKQYETCKFLCHAGADADYRPIAPTDNSPRSKASDIILQGGLSREAIEALQPLTSNSTFIEEQNFTLTHKIVLGLSLLPLEPELRAHPEHINALDANNRTPLTWASARGDDHAVVTLLAHGADPNILDGYMCNSLNYAADRGRTTTVRLLLESLADPDPKLPDGFKMGSALNCAARNATDPLLLKTLLDFGADIEASGVDGRTSLIHAARTDNASFAHLLMDNGANLNAMSLMKETPLTTAIAYNSHNVLQLLLNRWYEYTECPRLRGPHLLQIIAQYADIETIRILTATEHLYWKIDKEYTAGDFMTRLRERLDLTDKLSLAFEDLLSVISKEPDERHHNSILESGLIEHLKSRLELKYDSEQASEATYNSDELFEEALESLNLKDGDEQNVSEKDNQSACPTYATPISYPPL